MTDKPKNESAVQLGKLRWKNTTDEERRKHAQMMQKLSLKARNKKNKERPFAKLG